MGFMEKRSEAIDQNNQVDVIYTDFHKAFDEIGHYLLRRKPNHFGFSDYLLLLLESYLLNRKLSVKYRNFVSEPFCPTSGVPQGSNLGRLLFLLFVNDVVNFLTYQKLLYTDDLTVFLSISTLRNSEILQHNLDLLTSWTIERPYDRLYRTSNDFGSKQAKSVMCKVNSKGLSTTLEEHPTKRSEVQSEKILL